MKEPYWWYVLYVKSKAENHAVESFQRSADKIIHGYDVNVFFLESEWYYVDKQARALGKVYKKRPLFPGYVFVETNMPQNEFKAAASVILQDSSDIIRLLQNGKGGSIALQDDERQRLEYLFKGKRCLEHSVGYIEGDKIIITGGPLIGLEGSIKKINRHNRTATIEVQMFGQVQFVNVALEIFRKS